MSEPRSVSQLLDVGERVLAQSDAIFDDHDNAREAKELLAHVLKVPIRNLKKKLEPPRAARDRYLALVARRASGEPFPFLTGRIEFYGLDLAVWPGAFVPRPSSELLVARAIRRLRSKPGGVVVDVCTGAGPIALAVADEFPDAQVFGVDISEEGLEQGRRNARRLNIPNVRFKQGDMYDGLPQRLKGAVDVITGHVPYVPLDEIDDLPMEVRGYEPIFTLTDNSWDGLGLMRRAVMEAPEWLKPGGWLLLEMSEDHAAKVGRMARKAGLTDMGSATDADELSVVVEARRSR